jgi:outer membrane protein assembly factor BamB
MKFSEKEISMFKGISLISGIFTLVMAFTMFISLIQLKMINPLDNPALLQVKEQFDKDPNNKDKAEQVRAMDLMARKAYFSSRWQVETGSYLLLAGAAVFVILQRLIAGNEKPARSRPGDKPDINADKRKNRRCLIVSGSVVTILAIVSSFILRTTLPAPGSPSESTEKQKQATVIHETNQVSDVNYPFFRGEGSRGIAAGTGYPVEWNGKEGKNIKWKINLPKPGKSSPVIWGDKLFLTGAKEGEFEVYCLDKITGKILWTGSGSDFPGASKVVPESDNEAGMAVPTAAVYKDGICAIFGNGNLVCFDLDGKLKWAKNIGVPQMTYAFSASLLLYDKLLLVQYDSQVKIVVLGFDLQTGEQNWETPRTGRPVNSSPVLATFDGKPQIIINGNPNVSAFDPLTGKELWSQSGVTGDVVPSVAVNNKMVFAVTDYSKLVALKPGQEGSKVWEDNRFTPDVSSPVASDKFLFISTGNGDAACYSAEKGDTLWSHYFENPFYASPVICDGKVWLLDRSGTMHIIEAGDRFKIVATSPLGENTDCTPVFSEKRIYIRGKLNLYCIGVN